EVIQGGEEDGRHRRSRASGRHLREADADRSEPRPPPAAERRHAPAGRGGARRAEGAGEGEPAAHDAELVLMEDAPALIAPHDLPSPLFVLETEEESAVAVVAADLGEQAVAAGLEQRRDLPHVEAHAPAPGAGPDPLAIQIKDVLRIAADDQASPRRHR